MVRDSKGDDYENARCLFAHPYRYWKNNIDKATKKLEKEIAEKAKRGGGDRMDERRLALFNK